MDIDGFLRHGQEHCELMNQFEQINALLHQLTDGEYSSLDIYLNNLNHLREQIGQSLTMLRNRDFEEYLMQNDTALFYNLQSVILAVQVLKNLLENLASTMKRPVYETA